MRTHHSLWTTLSALDCSRRLDGLLDNLYLETAIIDRARKTHTELLDVLDARETRLIYDALKGVARGNN